LPRPRCACNRASELPNDNHAARIFERPCHRFIFLGAIWIASIEAEAFVMLTINDAPVNWRSIRVNIKDRQENPTRRVFVLRTSFSSSAAMSLTLPSAGATISFGSAGTGRFGSRKKNDREKKKR